MASVESAFHEAMLAIYSAAQELKPRYDARRFVGMAQQLGGLETAHRLLSAEAPQSGLSELWQRSALHLSVEALVLMPCWRSLFGKNEVSVARNRLSRLDYCPEEDPKWVALSTRHALEDGHPQNGARLMNNRITVDPGVCHGQACIRGTRIPVHQIVRMLAGGDSIEDLLQEYPRLTREDVFAALDYAASLAEEEFVSLGPAEPPR